MTGQNQVYWDGMAKLKTQTIGWPRSFRSVAELLGLPYEVFAQIRHSVFRGRHLTFLEAIEAWRWLCYMNRSPYMRELTGRMARTKKRRLIIFP